MAHVLITGANRGIGLALCKVYKERGDDVTAVCRKTSPALRDLRVRVEEGVDVTSESDLRDLSRRLERMPIDILINNAGAMTDEGFEDLDFEAMSKLLSINSLGPLRVTRALFDHFKPGSKVAMITSLMGSIGDNSSGGYYAYRMSKAALNAAAKSLAIDLRSRKIAVALLHPGYVQTDMTEGMGNLKPEDSARGIVRRIDELSLENTGTFWHSDGRLLPW